MSESSPRLLDYLEHIRDAILRIERYVDDLDELDFLQNDLVQDGVIRNLEVIGEAGRNIERDCPAWALAHPDVPLGLAYEMRNVLAHGYFKVDLELVWKTLQIDLPPLFRQVMDLLDEEVDNSP
ncbi:MAG: DUF86 domain-containing protein [Rhodocyclaceae bacterium]|nr:DUF86 domain-containing protein [Rhodocyclaceae bacterium]